MTDKQIIIDGVNVAGCEAYKPYLGKYDCIALGNKSAATCKGSPNCLFKQLARKTQECEGIKKQLERFKTENEKLKDKAYILFDEAIIERDNFIEELKAEKEQVEQEREALQMSDNEAREIIAELKAECEELKKELEAIYDDCKGCPTCNEALYNANLYAKEYRKLKQALTEIKGIAEENIRISDSEGLNGVYRRGLAEQIIQKINEVLND